MKPRLAAALSFLALTLTSCGDGTAGTSGAPAPSSSTAAGATDTKQPPPAYDGSKLEPGEKKFMDTVWAVSDNRAKLKAADAQTVKSVVAAYSLECLGEEKDREKFADDQDTDPKMPASDRAKLLTSWRSDLCGDAGKKAAVKDVALTRQGRQDHDVWGKNAYVVAYRITNSGPGTADYFVRIEFHDADGDFLGSTGVLVDRLGPGKSSTGESVPVPAEITNGTPGDIAEARVSEVERTPRADPAPKPEKTRP
ncbi:hypothetical protein ABZY44_15145 [Streptomyces sp. NPDC006544]|uniref:hypothetical protein n=1 Tax=Streptomyces sp. NPDC006544 TaxID=3154583 RepID=UPI0033B2C119